MTAKELYNKAVTENRNICVRNINNNNKDWFIFYPSGAVNRFSLIHGPLNHEYQEFLYLGDIFEEISDRALEYEDARDEVACMLYCTADYRSGKEIKEFFTTVVKLGEELFNTRIQTFIDFYNKYVVSEYPLSDRAEYCIKQKYLGGADWEIRAYKKR